MNMVFPRNIASLILSAVILSVGSAFAVGQSTIAITEFINNVEGDENTEEWVEIFNYGSSTVNLNGWTIQDDGSDNDPIPTITLNSGEFAIIAKNKVAFEAQWLGGTPNASVFEVSGLTLGNSDDEIRLFDNTSTQQWGLAYSNDETEGAATFLAVDDFSTTLFPTVDRSGNDSAGNLGYESNNVTTDPLATTQADDTGSPLAGNYTTTGGGPSTTIFDNVLPGEGSTTTVDFTGFDGSGFDPDPSAGQLDSDNFAISGFGTNVNFGDSENSGDPARGTSTGGESTGGIYAFDVGGGDVALGVQPAGSDFTPGAITLRLPNETGDVIDELDISGDLLVNNNEERGNTFELQYSTDGSSFTTFGSLTPVDGSDSLGFQSQSFAISLAGLDIQPGEFFFLQAIGNDLSGSGSRDEFAIDNLLITQPSSAAVPEPASLALWSLLAMAGLAFGIIRRAKNK